MNNQTLDKDARRRELRQAAAQYARRGWPVFPCYAVRDGRCTCGREDCGSPGKHPRTRNGLKDASTDIGLIRDWWTRWPDANIGLVTGEESGLAILDIDEDKGGVLNLGELIAQYKDGRFMTPLASRTGGGGCHYLFRYRDGLKNGTNVFAEGLDVRASGGYIIAPPSSHVSGKLYSWLWGAETLPSEFPPFPEVPEAPEVETTLKTRKQPGIIPKGERNDALTREAGFLRGLGKKELEINEALLRTNQERCNPPLAPDEVRRIAASVSKYPPGPLPRTHTGNAEMLGDRPSNRP